MRFAAKVHTSGAMVRATSVLGKTIRCTVKDILSGLMVNSILVRSKKTSDMVTVSLHGKTAESTKATGSKASSMVKEVTETQREKRREAYGTMESAPAGSTSLTTMETMMRILMEQSELEVKKLPVSFIRN